MIENFSSWCKRVYLQIQDVQTLSRDIIFKQLQTKDKNFYNI